MSSHDPGGIGAGAEHGEPYRATETSFDKGPRETDMPGGGVEEPASVDVADVHPELADPAVVAEIVAPTRTVHAEVGEPLLRMQDVTLKFGGLTALDSVTFDIRRGEILGLIGPNGAGKTTCFNTLTGLYKPTTGRVLFDGVDVTGKRPDIITQAGIARTFQNIKLFKTMTAVENVQVGMHGRMKAQIMSSIFRTPNVRLEERASRAIAHEMLDFVGLKRNQQGEIASNLSYGDQRRLEIARALASDPKLLLLDEPTAGMNAQESARLTGLMETLRQERGISILLIEHDMKVIMSVSDHITVLDHGEKIAEGKPEEVRQNPRVIEAYLGSQA